MKKFKSYIFKNGGEKGERKGKKEEYPLFCKEINPVQHLCKTKKQVLNSNQCLQ